MSDDSAKVTNPYHAEDLLRIPACRNLTDFVPLASMSP